MQYHRHNDVCDVCIDALGGMGCYEWKGFRFRVDSDYNRKSNVLIF